MSSFDPDRLDPDWFAQRELAIPGNGGSVRPSDLALHELCHVHQFATGAWLSEEQAEMFAWNALQNWRPT